MLTNTIFLSLPSILCLLPPFDCPSSHVCVCVSMSNNGSNSEENVWKLCEQVKKTRPAELSKCYAVFVSNEGRTVPLWRQKAGRGDDKVVIWVSWFVLFSPSLEIFRKKVVIIQCVINFNVFSVGVFRLALTFYERDSSFAILIAHTIRSPLTIKKNEIKFKNASNKFECLFNHIGNQISIRNAFNHVGTCLLDILI